VTQETLGYVKLEWICPKCSSRNPGSVKTCQGCGAPQPEDVKFVQAAGEVATQDEALSKIAAQGPDIHCPFCGTRNPGSAKICSQCGGDLVQGIRRESGGVVGAYKPEPVKKIACQNCGAENPETALNCSNCGAPIRRQPEVLQQTITTPSGKTPSKFVVLASIIGAVLFCVLAIWLFSFLSSPRETLQASVASVGWQTGVEILALAPVSRSTWRDEIPSSAEIGDCSERVYQVVNSEPLGERFDKICGTPYTIDTGSGVGRVVQDCQYQIYRPYCQFTTQEWTVLTVSQLSGIDLQPEYANPPLAAGQRFGSESASYQVVFETDNGKYQVKPDSLAEFQQYQVGSHWILKVNALGQIVSIEPAH
jgi:ribosomal protein L40E